MVGSVMRTLMRGLTRGKLLDEGCVLYDPGVQRYYLRPVGPGSSEYRAFLADSGHPGYPRGIGNWTRDQVLSIPVSLSEAGMESGAGRGTRASTDGRGD